MRLEAPAGPTTEMRSLLRNSRCSIRTSAHTHQSQKAQATRTVVAQTPNARGEPGAMTGGFYSNGIRCLSPRQTRGPHAIACPDSSRNETIWWPITGLGQPSLAPSEGNAGAIPACTHPRRLTWLGKLGNAKPPEPAWPLAMISAPLTSRRYGAPCLLRCPSITAPLVASDGGRPAGVVLPLLPEPSFALPSPPSGLGGARTRPPAAISKDGGGPGSGWPRKGCGLWSPSTASSPVSGTQQSIPVRQRMRRGTLEDSQLLLPSSLLVFPLPGASPARARACLCCFLTRAGADLVVPTSRPPSIHTPRQVVPLPP
jgi:hypothetical protein